MLGGIGGDMLIAVIDVVVSVVDPVMAPNKAEIVVNPVVVLAVTSPLLLTVAIPLSDDVQVAK